MSLLLFILSWVFMDQLMPPRSLHTNMRSAVVGYVFIPLNIVIMRPALLGKYSITHQVVGSRAAGSDLILLRSTLLPSHTRLSVSRDLNYHVTDGRQATHAFPSEAPPGAQKEIPIMPYIFLAGSGRVKMKQSEPEVGVCSRVWF